MEYKTPLEDIVGHFRLYPESQKKKIWLIDDIKKWDAKNREKENRKDFAFNYGMETVESLNKLINEEHRKEGGLIFSKVIYLLFEVGTCFRNGDYNAAVLMCRVSVDSTLYISATRYRYSNEAFSFDRNARKRLNEVGFAQRFHILENILKTKKIYDEEELKNLDSDVREIGNFIAHLIENEDREASEWFYTDYAARKQGMKNNEPFRNWHLRPNSKVDREMALQTLQKTKEHIIKIIDNYFKSELTYKDISEGVNIIKQHAKESEERKKLKTSETIKPE